MRRLNFVLLFLFFATSFAVAQKLQPQPFEEIKDGEYTIRVLPSPGGTFGYEILKGKLVIVHQPFSPFTIQQPNALARGIQSPPKSRMEGLKTKQDALKVAKFLVSQARTKGISPAGMLSDKLAKQLKINL